MKKSTDNIEASTDRPSGQSRNLLQVRLSPKADEKLQALVDATGITNRTHLVNAAIDLTEDIVVTIKRGGSVFYQLPDGSKERLKLVGV